MQELVSLQNAHLWWTVEVVEVKCAPCLCHIPSLLGDQVEARDTCSERSEIVTGGCLKVLITDHSGVFSRVL